MIVREVTVCRVCGSTDLDCVLDLGPVPLANALVDADRAGEPEFTAPLALLLCRACGLVSLSVVVDPARLFRTYPYVTGTSPSMRAHFGGLAAAVAARLPAGARLVVEMGSNDGTLLSHLQPPTRVLGVEPARNIAELARQRGVDTISEFFTPALARRIVEDRGHAGALVGTNVVAHIDDLAGLAEGARTLLDADGVFVFEVPHLLPFVADAQFDTIYHEHLSYFSLACLRTWLERAGFSIVDVEQVAVHGGTLRVWARPGEVAAGPRVEQVLALERDAGLAARLTWTRFAGDVASVRRELPAFLEARKAAGRRIAGYGAAAKGHTLLCLCGIDGALLDYVVDRNPLKQGRLTPGTHIEIVGPERLAADPVDDVLVLAWNLLDEIAASLPDHRARGGVFLVPAPRPAVVS